MDAIPRLAKVLRLSPNKTIQSRYRSAGFPRFHFPLIPLMEYYREPPLITSTYSILATYRRTYVNPLSINCINGILSSYVINDVYVQYSYLNYLPPYVFPTTHKTTTFGGAAPIGLSYLSIYVVVPRPY